MTATLTSYKPFKPSGVRRVVSRLATFILRLMGWRVGENLPDLPKYVAIAAFHTSNSDGILMLLYRLAFGVHLQFMMKDSWFRGPLGPVARWLGGIAIDRSAHHNTVAQMVETFQRRDHLWLLISPEGTRKQTRYWKSGFYHIAHQAGVPVVLGYLDYRYKVGSFGKMFMPSGDIEADFELLRAFYADITPRYPAKAGPIRLRPPAVEAAPDSPQEPALVQQG